MPFAPLSPEEQGLILELANMTAGGATTALGMLVDPNLEASEPDINEYASLAEWEAAALTAPHALAYLTYSNGLDLPMAFLVDGALGKALAAAVIGAPAAEGDTALSDADLSAIGELIGQMASGAAQNLTQFLSHPIEANPPQMSLYSAEGLMGLMPTLADDGVVAIRYQLTGSAALPPGALMQVFPASVLQAQLSRVSESNTMSGEVPMSEEPMLAGVGASAPSAAAEMGGPVTVQPVAFPSFDNQVSASGGLNKNLELVMDVGLNLTVELGRTEIPIKEVLELTRGSVIELSRIAGEPVDLLANGKVIAKGEVVVIEDNFGLRITSIVSPADRLRGL